MSNFRDIPASDRFVVGQNVVWTSKSGNEYEGYISRIREPLSEDLYERGALVTVEIDAEKGIIRNFYENEVSAYVMV